MENLTRVKPKFKYDTEEWYHPVIMGAILALFMLIGLWLVTLKVQHREEARLQAVTAEYNKIMEVKPKGFSTDFTKPGWEKEWTIDPCLNVEQTDQGALMSIKPECNE